MTPDRRAPVVTGMLAGIVGAATWLAAPGAAQAQQCAYNSGTYVCYADAEAPSYYFFEPGAITNYSPNAYPLLVYGQAGFTMSVQPGQGTALNYGAYGENGSGGNVYGLMLTNSYDLTLNYGSGWNLTPYGIQTSLGGGSGNPGGFSAAGATNIPGTSTLVPGGINVTNYGAITLNMSGTQSTKGAAIWANEYGGAGQTGGSGGWTTGVVISNGGALNVNISSEGQIGGIVAQTYGGDGNSDSSANGSGGHSGSATVYNWAPVTVNFVWPQGATSNGGQFGILAATIGGDAGSGGSVQADGGAGGASAGAPTIKLTGGGNVTLNASGTGPSLPTPPASGGLVAMSVGGAGGLGGDGTYGYDGGAGGNATGGTIDVTDSQVTTTGGYLPGLLVLAQGGVGGNGGAYNSNHEHAKAGFGGTGGSVTWGATVNLSGSYSGATVISTTGDHSPGVYVLLAGANGGQGAVLNDGLDEGTGGYGGSGGSASPNNMNGNSINISLSGASVATQGDTATGILAVAQGGTGQDGQGGDDFSAVYGGNGGDGGGAGNIQISLDGGSSVTTQGDDSHGVVAQSVGGGAGNGGAGSGVAGNGGVGGTGGDTGSAQVNNAGVISTAGQMARGIIVQSLAGSGGGGGGDGSLLPGYGGNGLAGGVAGSANVTHGGSISTQGGGSHGVLLQSIAGGGGAGGSVTGIMASVGGSGALGGNGNSVYFQSSGSIATKGISAHGVIGQSIGGGGGDGGGAANLTVTVGGSAGAGGSGGPVVADLNAGTSITTAGPGAAGVVMQGIGGGGGNAGNATSVGIFTSIAIGGTGGGGGGGGEVQVTATNASILTQSGMSPGIIAQSIGGGGGTGGQAISGSFSVGFSAGVAIGGSGGNGGAGGPATVNVIGSSITTGLDPLLQANPGPGACPSLPCNLLPADSHGVLIQSIGGGGGHGGSALAESAAIGLPVDGASVSGTADFSMGGTGGNGQNAGPVFFGLSNGGAIATSGTGSHGALVQAIGGGGGAGGDSTSMGAAVGYGSGAADDDSVNLGVTLTFSMGGNGGTGGHGGNVLVAMGGTVPGFNNNPSYNSQSSTQDAAGSAPTSIITYGDFSNGLVAQSVGGGGGNAGIGGGNTQGFGEASSYNLQLNLGSTGGAAGGGGYIAANLYSGSITTWGAGSIGFLAQSIAGGGGTSQGGSFNIAQSFKEGDTTVKPGIDMAIGGLGVAGQNGGPINAYIASSITTKGGDAPGAVIQSIAGGGGVGGSAAADGSNDNPIIPQKAANDSISALKAREANSNLNSLMDNGTLPTIDLTWGVTVGGTGGTGGDGGAINVGLAGSINTAGDWSKGLVAQSIGGGGGKGGSSAASGTGGLPEITVNLLHAVGGSGGASGNGANVGLSLEGTPTITTAGFGAAGILAQSIGAGGGIGVDGTDVATGLISIGAGTQSGQGGAGGYGASVMLSRSGSSAATITTTGDAADGVVMQSIGGGGGFGGTGSSLFQSGWTDVKNALTLIVGGAGNANGTGGYVSFDSSDGPMNISTAGYNAFGILAQSIGGGGGVVTSTQTSSNISTLLGGTSNQNGGNGGAVYVNLANNSSITTSGVGAFGIAAQSIGGGGGVIRVTGSPTNIPALYTGSSSSTSQTTPSAGSGSTVSVIVDSTSRVAVGGAGAIGIFAQSVTGGGGLIANEGGMFAGAPLQGQSCPNCGNGGEVAVTVNGSVSATGKNGTAIFAQTAGANPGAAVINVSGSITGSTTNNQPGPQGAAPQTLDMTALIQMDAPGSTSTLTIGPGGNVVPHNLNGSYGNAVQSHSGASVVELHGTLTGRTLLRDGLLNIHATGVHHTDAQTQAGRVVNAGTMNIGKPGLGAAMRTTLTGLYEQTAGGVLGVTVDSLNNTAGYVNIVGSASVDGVIAPTAVTLLPGTHPVLSAGTLTGMPDTRDSLLFRWDTSRSGNTLSITPTATFMPFGVPLNDSQRSMAGYFGRAWNNADPGMAQLFATLSRVSNGAVYGQMLNTMSGRAAHTQSMSLVNSAGSILGSSMSCPTFQAQGVSLGEGNCVWGQVSGRWSVQANSSRTLGYDTSGTSFRIGAQRQIAPEWYLGGSAAISESRTHIRGGSVGDSDIYDGSITLKRISGPWQMAGSLALAKGEFDTWRRMSFPGATAMFSSNSETYMAGARLRVGYEFAHSTWYVRPYGDLDLIYTSMQGFRENGNLLYALDARRSNKMTVALSPMVEVGQRINLDDNTSLRAYAALGMRYTPDNTFRIDSSFINATRNNGTFTDYMDTPQLLGKVDIGLQMFRAGGLEIKAGYSADFSRSFVSQSANIRLGYYF